ncbi:MAG: sigma-54 dependent transcriptional regulator [Candidatus Manganitrophus sp. SA1]|nr:sigma-54 dependent transcriptional regulator [Candidatus Manganitrophus morganii]
MDDEEEVRGSIKDFLAPSMPTGLLSQKPRYRVWEAASGAETREMIKKQEIDVILLDIHLKDECGLDLLDEIKKMNESPEVVIMTAYVTIDNTVEAVKRGAFDFIPKTYSLEQFEGKIVRAVEHHRLKAEAVTLRAGRSEAVSMIGNSQRMIECLQMACQLAGTDRRILILGETGTGKEVLARYIHSKSNRSGAPFIAISCTNLSPELVESDLFGHVKGAFTSAHTDRLGKVELANGGTLFLDEIGDAPLSIQGKLLRFLETNRYMRVGGTKEKEANVRIIAATNRNLTEDIKAGKFREDLFYRLNVIQITLPPLKNRREDIPDLVHHFLKDQRIKSSQVEPFVITAEAMEILLKYDWPGNIRELRNVIERATALTGDGHIRPKHLQITKISDDTTSGCSCHVGDRRYGDQIEECKRRILEVALEMAGGNKTAAAKNISMDRSDFWRKLRQFGLSD